MSIMPMPGRLARRTLVGLPVAFSLACRIRRVAPPRAADFSYGPSPHQHVDVYSAAQKPGHPAPLVMLIGGGGWQSAPRTDAVGFVPVFTSRGHVVANVGYRVTSEARAPAAAEDVRNAIEAARCHAAQLGADSRGMLLVGFSAGAHLALLSALAPTSDLAGPQSQPRAIVSFWGVTDFASLLSGDHANVAAQRWLPEGPERPALARRLSPINYDVSEAPALCAVHSVLDDVVPFWHSERLVAKYLKAGRPAKLIKLAHRGHAAPAKDYPKIFDEIFRFLDGLGNTA
jgi:acetyl esterase/lipase